MCEVPPIKYREAFWYFFLNFLSKIYFTYF